MQLVERRMQVRAVQALVVVEDDQLPVRLHVVDDAAAETEIAHAPRGERDRADPRVALAGQRAAGGLPGQRRDPAREKRTRCRPNLAAGAMQRIVVLRELGRHVRRREQLAVERVGPVVIRALDAIDEMTFGLIAQPRAAMAADVEQRVNLARRVARDDDALVAERAREVVAGVRNLIGAAGADPAVEIEALELGAIEVRVGVEAAGKGGVHSQARLLKASPYV